MFTNHIEFRRETDLLNLAKVAKETHVKSLFAAKILNAFGRFLDLIWESQESLLYAKVCGERLLW